MKRVITGLTIVLFFALGCGGRATKDETAKDTAKIDAAITAVQNYPTPSGDTVLVKIAKECTRYEKAGRIVSVGGWGGEKITSDKYEVGFSAKVDKENLWWEFYYYPSTGEVEPNRSLGRAKEVWY